MFGKTLVVVLLLFSIGCGEVSRDVDQPIASAPEKIFSPDNFQLPNVAQWVKDGGGHFEDYGVRDATAPNMLLNRWINSNPPEYLRQSQVNLETAQALREDTALAIDLHDVVLTEELRAQLALLHRVQWLRLSLGINSEDLRWIGSLKQLRGLALTHVKLAGADFQHLAAAKSLQYLTLTNSEFTDSEFGSLPRLARLERLCLSGRQINDACVKHLAEVHLPSLRSLTLEFSSVTNEGLRRFCEVYDLEYLNLYCSREILANSVPTIAKMKRLHALGVGGTGISPQYQRTEAVAELIRRLPKCSVDYGD